MNLYELSKEQFAELMRLCHLYRREAQKCMAVKSYLAGCVMIGAALEAALIAMCHLCSDEIPTNLIPKKRNGKPKNLLDWPFFHLLRVARECKWLPAGLSLDDEWDSKKAEVGDYSVVVQQFRNLVHPSCYIAHFSKRRVTKRRMEMCFEIVETASDYLLKKVYASLKAALSKSKEGSTNKRI